MTLPLEKQVCSLDLAKGLKELGVKQESCFDWVQHRHRDGEVEVYIWERGSWSMCSERNSWSAFTVPELGQIILDGKGDLANGDFPEELQSVLDTNDSFIRLMTSADYWTRILIHMLENKLITV